MRTFLLLAGCFSTGLVAAVTTNRQDEAATASPPTAPPPRAPVPSRSAPVKRNFLPPGFVPSQVDREMLSWDDATLRQKLKDMRPEVLAHCRDRLPQATDDFCEQIYQANVRISPKFIDTRRRLLRGEIDGAQFQSTWHKLFLEREIEAEQFMTWEEMQRVEGVPPGTDLFMVLTRWGMDLPDGFKLGLEEPPGAERAEAALQPEER
jgi:hypothetical protein